jgi:uncharacterized protein (DUF1330 family)
MRKAYWINIFTAVHDAAKLEAYVRLAGPAMRAAGGRFLARGSPAAAVESGTTLRTTLIELPSVGHAVAAYHSAAYQEALRVLAGGAEREIRIIEAVQQPTAMPPGSRSLRDRHEAGPVRGWRTTQPSGRRPGSARRRGAAAPVRLARCGRVSGGGRTRPPRPASAGPTRRGVRGSRC